MKPQEIVDGDILIADFMGWDFERAYTGANSSRNDKWLCPYSHSWIIADRFRFRESWDWLMDVVAKIENLGLKVNIGITSCTIYSAKYNIEPVYADTKINAVWLAVVDFIKWHNETQPAQ